MTARRSIPLAHAAVLAVAVALASASAAQDGADTHAADAPATQGSAPPFPGPVLEWIGAERDDPALRDRAVAAVRTMPRGLAALARQAAAIVPANGHAERRWHELATAVLLDFVDEQKKSEMVYAGQYAPLGELQPFASERALDLLLRTPDWFAETRRVDLVPVLRDLMPRPPEPPLLLGIVALIEDADHEPENLRLALECLVWQWGRKSHVQARIDRLRAATADGDAEDRVFALRQLADVWYRVQDYERAANTQQAMVGMATAAHLYLSPTDWYWAACFASLSGNVVQGLGALRHCAERNSSPSTDSSQKLPRKLFDRDPELARLRAEPEFAAIVQSACVDESPEGARKPAVGSGRSSDRTP